MRARIAASIVLAVSVVLGTAGCNMIAPQATTKHYNASDGVSGNVGQVAVRNAILISQSGTDANLLVTFVNSDTRSHRIGIQHEVDGKQTTQHVTLPASETTVVGTPDEPLVILDNIDTQPGALFPVFFQYGDQTGISLLVPVLDGTLPTYKNLTPERVTEADAKDLVTG
ncbi:MAG: hypothetical protein ABI255_06595 [Microbacteriaceae bacterium]